MNVCHYKGYRITVECIPPRSNVASDKWAANALVGKLNQRASVHIVVADGFTSESKAEQATVIRAQLVIDDHIQHGAGLLSSLDA